MRQNLDLILSNHKHIFYMYNITINIKLFIIMAGTLYIFQLKSAVPILNAQPKVLVYIKVFMYLGRL